MWFWCSYFYQWYLKRFYSKVKYNSLSNILVCSVSTQASTTHEGLQAGSGMEYQPKLSEKYMSFFYFISIFGGTKLTATSFLGFFMSYYCFALAFLKYMQQILFFITFNSTSYHVTSFLTDSPKPLLHSDQNPPNMTKVFCQ